MNHYSMELLAQEHVQRLRREAAYRGPRRPGGARRLAASLMILLLAAVLSALVLSAPVSADGASTDRIEDFETVVAVRFEEDFPLRSLMRADCAFLQRVERPDGSARETMSCDLSDRPVMIPDFQGVPPVRAIHYSTGACMWVSDYWFYVAGATVYADWSRVVVTPAGKVHAESTYPAEPLDCG